MAHGVLHGWSLDDGGNGVGNGGRVDKIDDRCLGAGAGGELHDGIVHGRGAHQGGDRILHGRLSGEVADRQVEQVGQGDLSERNAALLFLHAARDPALGVFVA
ncbi:hypothetical protein HC891_05275 [Candidatus Gracilibacteria bacterium]|nr:hypothetical protein [Candidatus Gracilibacteria bacterium]